MSSSVYELRIALERISPTTWRDFRVRSDMTLEELHGVIPAIMGWDGGHLYLFRKVKTIYVDAFLRDISDSPSAGQTTVTDLLVEPQEEIAYVYDLGDDWQHRITLRSVFTPSVPAPVCLNGARACPPEDCGGVPGYHDIPAALEGTELPSHGEILDWSGAATIPRRSACKKSTHAWSPCYRTTSRRKIL